MHLFDFDEKENDLSPTRLYLGKILIVDEAKSTLQNLIELLREAAHTVDVCTEPTLVLEMAIADPPDLIISNISITESEGCDLCDRLKSHPSTQNIPFIAISTANDHQAKATAFEAGANDYIATPFDPKEVLLRVKNHLRTRALYLQLAKQNRILQTEIIMRHHAEQKLKLAEEKFRKAFYSSPNPSTITLLSDGTHIEVNDNFCESTGYTREEILGRSAVELGLWVNIDAREELFQLIRNGQKVHNHEFEFCTKHGKIRTAILSCEIINIDGQECLLSLSNDITERKQAESRLKVANRTLQTLADLDGLTKIANRRRFDSYLKYHWEKAQHEDLNLTLFLCDVDHFKAYNDHYGHLQGDACLMQLAKILRTRMPSPTDLVARYGGEEFAIILPGRSPSEGAEIVQHIWQTIQETNLLHAASPTAEFVTVSFGGCTFIPSGTVHTARQLIGRADEALYQAKQQGRNRVIFCEMEGIKPVGFP